MAEIETDVTNASTPPAERAPGGRAVARRNIRTGAVALALLGVAALVVHPGARTRAEARLTVPAPLDAGDVVTAVRAEGGGATVTAHGRRIAIAASDANRGSARAHVEAVARAGLDGARQRITARQTRRADAAKRDRAQAAGQLTSLASRTGLSDPESAYRELAAVVQSLKEQLAAATSAGRPVAAINAQLAGKQQDAFELQLQVTRHAELTQAEATAARRELAATDAINSAKRAATRAPVEVSDRVTGADIGIAGGVAALVLAGIVLLVAGRKPRREPEPVGEPNEIDLTAVEDVFSEPAALEDAALEDTELEPAELEPAALEDAALEPGVCDTSRYLEFYRALAPSPEATSDPAPGFVDLADEEARDEALEEDRELAPEHALEHHDSRSYERAGDA